ncbi:MAG: hypothetical protein V1809_13535 [Planctomycetota bacterium]
MRQRVIIGSAILLVITVAIVFLLPSRQLASQYLASQFTCACHHTMVLEFIGGKVRLHNVGHKEFYECGSFDINESKKMIWHLPDYGIDLTMQPERFGLRVSDDKSGKSLRFQRSFKSIDTLHDTESKQKMKEYVKNLMWIFNN